MTVNTGRSTGHKTATLAMPRPAFHRLTGQVVPTLIVLSAIAAGGLHLVHSLLPMAAPFLVGDLAGPRGATMPATPPMTGGPPMAGGAPGGAPAGLPDGAVGGLLGLVMPYMNELFILNFVAYVVLGIAFLLVRRRPSPRRIVDAMLILLSLATLSLWATMGRPDPLGTGTMALVAEVALIVLAAIDAIVAGRPASGAEGALRRSAAWRP